MRQNDRLLLRTRVYFVKDVYKRQAPALSVALSLLSGILIVYMLIIMMAPQLYESFMTLWNSIPEKINTFVRWATERFGDEKNVTQILELLNTNSESLYNQLETWGQNMLSTYLGDLNSLLTCLLYTSRCV